MYSAKLGTLQSATIIVVTYDFQMNVYRYINAHMFRTDNELLFRLKTGAKVVKLVREIGGTSDDTKI